MLEAYRCIDNYSTDFPLPFHPFIGLVSGTSLAWRTRRHVHADGRTNTS
jgi:hypothetical protein